MVLTIPAYAEPDLPEGLGISDQPGLPAGLDDLEIQEPIIIEEDTEQEQDKNYELYGFWENRIGYRVKNTQLHASKSISESRLHAAFDKDGEKFSLQTAGDILFDSLADSHRIDLESGDGWLDIRKLNVLWKPVQSLDVRIGRQILTWGTGDFLFLNDLFPKDWSYYLGRDIEYVKAPSDALKVSFYSQLANIDIVYVPRFDSDRYINGERMSFYHDIKEEIVGLDNIIQVDKPDKWFNDDEFHLRISQNFNRTEVALYGYEGFFKSPAAYIPTQNLFTFTRLSVYGFSLRRPLAAGIFNAEMAYWHSKDDPDGDKPLINNGETRLTIGYQWEAAKDLTIGLQYYAQHLHDYNNYKENLPTGSNSLPKQHELFTIRLTQLLLNQNLKLGLFSFYTPENNDFYIRSEANYKINDAWMVEAGASIFGNGDGEDYANFGQLEENSNIYLMIRYSFADL